MKLCAAVLVWISKTTEVEYMLAGSGVASKWIVKRMMFRCSEVHLKWTLKQRMSRWFGVVLNARIKNPMSLCSAVFEIKRLFLDVSLS
jgi:hypothetical protein